jgi:hypothetical protein
LRAARQTPPILETEYIALGEEEAVRSAVRDLRRGGGLILDRQIPSITWAEDALTGCFRGFFFFFFSRGSGSGVGVSGVREYGSIGGVVWCCVWSVLCVVRYKARPHTAVRLDLPASRPALGLSYTSRGLSTSHGSVVG